MTEFQAAVINFICFDTGTVFPLKSKFPLRSMDAITRSLNNFKGVGGGVYKERDSHPPSEGQSIIQSSDQIINIIPYIYGTNNF